MVSGRPEDDAGRARRPRASAGGPQAVPQLSGRRERELAEQTGGHAQSRHGEAGRQIYFSGARGGSNCVRLSLQNHRLMRDGFVLDVGEGGCSLRHLFLYTDLLLCTRFKQAGRG